MNFISKNELKIDKALFNFINDEVLPGTNIKQDDFWDRFAKVVHELAPINKKLIEKREKSSKKSREGSRRLCRVLGRLWPRSEGRSVRRF